MKKISWGVWIVCAFAVFISFIMYFVMKVQTNSEYDHELVVEEYYKHDANFDSEFAMLQNAKLLEHQPQIDVMDDGIQISFPDGFAPDTKGKVSLYRPSASKLDFERPVSGSGPMLIPNSDLAGGRWDITLSWNQDGKNYMIRKTLYLDL